jgi:hypothetical protein
VPEHLNNPEEFLATVQSAKQPWEIAIELECKAEGLVHPKHSYPDYIDYYGYIHRAYEKKIAYYAVFNAD